MRRLAVSLLVALCALAVTSAAWAHQEAHEPGDAATLVHQAIAALQTSPPALDVAVDKVGDALEAKESDGVDLDLVRQAQAAIQGKDYAAATMDLERALTAAEAKPSPAPAMSTGGMAAPAPAASAPTSTAVSEPVRPVFTGTPVEYGLIALAAVLVLLGGIVVART